MADAIKSTAERIRRAQSAAEYAATELIRAGERYTNDLSSDDRMWRRRDLLQAARTYGRAMDRLTMVRK